MVAATRRRFSRDGSAGRFRCILVDRWRRVRRNTTAQTRLLFSSCNSPKFAFCAPSIPKHLSTNGKGKQPCPSTKEEPPTPSTHPLREPSQAKSQAKAKAGSGGHRPLQYSLTFPSQHSSAPLLTPSLTSPGTAFENRQTSFASFGSNVFSW